MRGNFRLKSSATEFNHNNGNGDVVIFKTEYATNYLRCNQHGRAFPLFNTNFLYDLV